MFRMKILEPFSGWHKVTFLLLLTAIGASSIVAQTNLRVHYKDGTRIDVSLAKIDSITFEDGDADTTAVEQANLTGEWLWGSQEQGYYEVLTFYKDRTYTGYDNYFIYGFDTWTFGRYTQYGAMLTLLSNGFGYQHRYNWFVTALTDNALAVMTKMGPFTYYRLLPETLHLSPSTPYALAEGDSVVFADGIIVKAESSTLRPLGSGTTYILIHHQASDRIEARKVVVEE